MKIDYRPNRAGWKRLHGCSICGGEWTTKDHIIVCDHCGHVKWVQQLPPSDRRKTDAEDPATEP